LPLRPARGGPPGPARHSGAVRRWPLDCLAARAAFLGPCPRCGRCARCVSYAKLDMTYSGPPKHPPSFPRRPARPGAALWGGAALAPGLPRCARTDEGFGGFQVWLGYRPPPSPPLFKGGECGVGGFWGLAIDPPLTPPFSRGGNARGTISPLGVVGVVGVLNTLKMGGGFCGPPGTPP
jgi:hypothetical protein